MLSTSTLSRLMAEGGPIMWVLLLFSIVTVAVAGERAWVLYRARTPLPSLLAKVRRALGGGSVGAALDACRQARGAVATVVAAGLHAYDSGEERMTKAMEAAALVELRRLARGIGVLATIAATAPLLGFLGTVTGMMASFQALVDHGLSDPTMVALGIKEALTTTAAGLIVALPAQLAHNALAGQLHRLEGAMEMAANVLLERVAQRG